MKPYFFKVGFLGYGNGSYAFSWSIDLSQTNTAAYDAANLATEIYSKNYPSNKLGMLYIDVYAPDDDICTKVYIDPAYDLAYDKEVMTAIVEMVMKALTKTLKLRVRRGLQCLVN